MLRRTALTWSFLHCLTKRRAEALINAFGDLDEALKFFNQDLLQAIGCRRDTIIPTMNRFEEFDADAYEQEMTALGLSLVTYEDDAYPKRLKEIADHPLFLYYRGDLSALDHPCIALVGTREMSPYGQRVVEHLVPPLVRGGCTTVSGLARGIDTVVAEETLTSGGRHAAVLGNGLRTIFPAQNAKLAEKIVVGGGVILSEFPIDMPGTTYSFPARNRVIAGLSIGTVVCEAPEKSGALITADLALEYGRDVFVVPGQIFDAQYDGCHRFLSRGQAKLVRSADDILKEVGVAAVSSSFSSSYEPQNPLEALIFKALTSLPQTADDIVTKASVPPADVGSGLVMLELAGAVRKIGNGWIRI